jgi:signal transduction histidine kinase
VISSIDEVDGVQTMSVAVPVHPGKPNQGALRVSVPTTQLTGRIHQFWTVLAGVAVLVLAGGALVAVGLARWIGRPVRALERATQHLADGGDQSAATTKGPPELRRLAVTFNVTAARLQRLMAAQRAFAGHASHQLKTPLAALRLRLENLEPDVRADGTRNLQAALAETDRLAALVDSLLAMARSEGSLQPCEPTAVPPVVAGRVDTWRPIAEDRGITLHVSGPDQTVVRALPGAVEQILDNLLSNALNAAPPGSAVAVTWRPGASDNVELHVVDTGPGLTEGQRGEALEPFWRAPGAANGGTGLGLALVRKLAEASGGQAQLAAAEPHGVDAFVVLPVAGNPALTG